MKNKYQRLSKEEKKQCKNAYYTTTEGKMMNIRLFRLSLTGVLGILVAAFFITNNYINNNVDWTTWITTIPLAIASVIFIISSIVLRRKNLNKFAIKSEKHTK